MKEKTGILLVLVCIAAIVCAGCTGSAPAGSPAGTEAKVTALPVTMEIPTPLATTVPVLVQNTSVTPNTTVTAKAIATIPAKTADPILHRYIFKWPEAVKGIYYGFEYKFYPDGSVIYKYGPLTEVSSVMTINPTSQMGGTWTNLGENKYLVKVIPEGKNVQSYTREYTWVAEYEDPLYPGKINKEHIESDYERNAIFPGWEKLDRMYYPERAKTD
ncbi:MAG: hypothetical protein Q8R70_00545 [Methanoregula sp.]|nr:hypothetical protein [Methanoregula sp.]